MICHALEYTAADGTHYGPEDIRRSATRHKYGDAMAEYLDMQGTGDEETGSVEWDIYVIRFGKRLLISDDQGFVWVEKYPTEDEARMAFDRTESEYGKWDDDEGEEQ